MRLDLAILTAAIQFFFFLVMSLAGWVSINRQLARLTAQVEILLSARQEVSSWADGPRRRMGDAPQRD